MQIGRICKSYGFDPIMTKEPDEVVDGVIQFIGWHLQVGSDYVCAVIEEDDVFIFDDVIEFGDVATIFQLVEKALSNGVKPPQASE